MILYDLSKFIIRNNLLYPKKISFCYHGSVVLCRCETDNISIPYTDLKPRINKFFLTKWQQRWNNNINKKLFQINPTLREGRPAFWKLRRKQVIIFRLRIGHTSLTHSFILKQGQPPQCLTCQTPYTIKHMLVECGALAVTGERHFKTDYMRDMFEIVHRDDVLSFLRYTGLNLKI